MNYLKMFSNMHPGFFDDPGITGMPKKLGYKTVLKWNSDGIVMEKQHEE